MLSLETELHDRDPAVCVTLQVVHLQALLPSQIYPHRCFSGSVVVSFLRVLLLGGVWLVCFGSCFWDVLAGLLCCLLLGGFGCSAWVLAFGSFWLVCAVVSSVVSSVGGFWLFWLGACFDNALAGLLWCLLSVCSGCSAHVFVFGLFWLALFGLCF